MIPRISKTAMKETNITILIAPFLVLAVLSIECFNNGDRVGKNTQGEHDGQSEIILL